MLITALTATLWFGLLGLLVLVAWRLLTGRMNTNALLYARDRDGKLSFSPERVQLLAITLAVAAQYLGQVSQDPSQLPDISPTWLYVLGGSHTVYLSAKSYR